MTAQAGAVAAWIDGHPTEPGIYRVRGFHIGHPDDFAVVEVAERDGELLTNLHECNSDRHSWLRVSDLSERMQWQRVDTPAAVPVEALEGLVAELMTRVEADKSKCTNDDGSYRSDVHRAAWNFADGLEHAADKVYELIKDRSNG